MGWLEAVVDFDSGSPATLLEYLEVNQEGYWDAALFALAGQTENASMLIEDPASAEALGPPFLVRDWANLARGQLALADGDFETAIELLSTETRILFISAPHAHQFGLRSRALTHLGNDQVKEAIETLEFQRRQKPATILDPGATWFWQSSMVLVVK